MAEQTPLTGALPTFTVTDCSGEVCPLPVHWKVKVVAAVSGSVRPEPEVVLLLVHAPPAVQLVAFVELQVSVDCPLYATEDGRAVRVAVGAGFASEQEAVVPPFAPVQLQV